MNIIKLNIKDKSIISLSGRSFGNDIYKEQIYENVKDVREVTLEFPSQIISVASSFAQGLLSYEVEKIGLDNVKKKFKIYSNVSGFEENFWESFD